MMSRLMRFLLISLMLVLLPLRGWAGDVMAVNMASSTAAQAKMVSMTKQASMPADCAMHAQPQDAVAAAYCINCDTCELCLVVANLTFNAWTGIQQLRHLAPLAIDASFTNAARVINLKPPIF